jgi:RNA polymerase sigma-70 factor (ECF subfamily)
VKTIAPSLFTNRRTAGNGPAPGLSPPGAGQVDEFKRLILPHLDGAYSLARYLTRDAALAEDVAQDAMLRAFRAFGQYRGGSARAWLFTIVRNCCRTAQVAGSGAMSLVIHESSLGEVGATQMANHRDERPTPEEAVQREDTVAHVREAVAAIPEPFREAVVLRELEELSYAEIAEVTGVPIGTVMSRLARGRAMLAKQLLPPSKSADKHSRSVK